MIMIFMIPMNLHRGHGVGVALCQVLQGAVVPICATRIIKVSLKICNNQDGYVRTCKYCFVTKRISRIIVKKAEQKKIRFYPCSSLLVPLLLGRPPPEFFFSFLSFCQKICITSILFIFPCHFNILPAWMLFIVIFIVTHQFEFRY